MSTQIGGNKISGTPDSTVSTTGQFSSTNTNSDQNSKMTSYLSDIVPPKEGEVVVGTVTPGGPVTLTASGWLPGELVTITYPDSFTLALTQPLASDNLFNMSALTDGEEAQTAAAFLFVTYETEAGATVTPLAGGALSVDQAAYLQATAESMGADTKMLGDLNAGLALLANNGDTPPEDLLLNFIRLVLPETNISSGEITLDVSSIARDFMLAAYLPDLEGATLALGGMEKVMVLGEGSVKINGGQNGMIVGDSFNQVIIGGGGSDTLVGGGGNDTLTGGSAPDVFGFNALGHYTITDFITGYDKLAFEVPGVTSKAALQAFLTSVTNTGSNTTFNFGSDASITLVGVNASGLFDDMLFNIS